jgi:hypothetical protein
MDDNNVHMNKNQYLCHFYTKVFNILKAEYIVILNEKNDTKIDKILINIKSLKRILKQRKA